MIQLNTENMITFKSEEWLEDHIIKNFNNFFPFKFKARQVVLLNSRGYDEIDIIGEDDKNVYIIELKRDYVRRKDIDQVIRYVKRYKSETSKNVIGYIVSPYFTNRVRLYAENNNIIVYELHNYICNAGHNCCSNKIKKLNSIRNKKLKGGPRPGAGAPKQAPPTAKRRNLLLTDAELKLVRELLTTLRQKEVK